MKAEIKFCFITSSRYLWDLHKLIKKGYNVTALSYFFIILFYTVMSVGLTDKWIWRVILNGAHPQPVVFNATLRREKENHF